MKRKRHEEMCYRYLFVSVLQGLDKDFDLALELFYRPYHEFLDIMFRVAVTSNHFTEPLVHLSLLTGIEGVVLHFNIFAKFWVGIYNNKTTHR